MRLMAKRKFSVILASLLAAVVLVVMYFLSVYLSTPPHIRKPTFEHYHFRTQIMVDGAPVNFAEPKFQTKYDSTACSAEPGGHPVDFHDNADQMTHVHWKGVTGGEFLKYYGWNLIGGDPVSLGFRYDKGLWDREKINIFGNLMPVIPEKAKFYVYIGDKEEYQQKNWQNFLYKDLEEFFGKQSNLSNQTPGFNWLEWLFPKALAHGGVDDEHDESELSRINNLIGNVVIFVQSESPTAEQIEARFDQLIPLSKSSCGG